MELLRVSFLGEGIGEGWGSQAARERGASYRPRVDSLMFTNTRSEVSIKPITSSQLCYTLTYKIMYGGVVRVESHAKRSFSERT